MRFLALFSSSIFTSSQKLVVFMSNLNLFTLSSYRSDDVLTEVMSRFLNYRTVHSGIKLLETLQASKVGCWPSFVLFWTPDSQNDLSVFYHK